MKKHLLSLLLLLCMVLALTVPAFAAPSISETIVDNSILLAVGSPLAYVQGKQGNVDPNNSAVTPLIVENRTLVPVRFIAESLDMKVDWDQKTQTALISSDGYDIRVTIGSKTMYVNGKGVELDVPAMAHEERTFVPLRAISEALDKKVYYHNNLILVSVNGYDLDTNDKGAQTFLDILREELFLKNKVEVTFSANIGEVDGVAYATRDVPGLKKLPVNTHGYAISGFCEYDGYVYYILKSGGSADFNTWLYRCGTDWTGEQLLHTMIWDDSFVIRVFTGFVIDNGILYLGQGGGCDNPCIDLSTLEVSTATTPVYAVKAGDTIYDSTGSVYGVTIKVYNDITAVDLFGTLYIAGGAGSLASYELGDLEGGVAGGYLYYATIEMDTGYGCLYRVPLNGGTVELVDSHMAAGGGFYFNF